MKLTRAPPRKSLGAQKLGVRTASCLMQSVRFEVDCADLFEYEDPLVPDIVTGADVFDLDSLSDYRSVVTNLPYEDQVAILAHILPIAARDGCSVAALARSEWRSAQDRGELVHDNPRRAARV